MGTDCKSAAFSFGGSNPPAPTKNSSIRTGYWSFCFVITFPEARPVDSNSIDPPNRQRRDTLAGLGMELAARRGKHCKH